MESLQVNVDEALIVSKQDDLRPSTSGIRRARTAKKKNQKKNNKASSSKSKSSSVSIKNVPNPPQVLTRSKGPPKFVPGLSGVSKSPQKTAMGTSVITRSQQSRMQKSVSPYFSKVSSKVGFQVTSKMKSSNTRKKPAANQEENVGAGSSGTKTLKKRKYESVDSNEEKPAVNTKKPCKLHLNSVKSRPQRSVQSSFTRSASSKSKTRTSTLTDRTSPDRSFEKPLTSQSPCREASYEESNGVLTAPSTPTRSPSDIEGGVEWLERYMNWNEKEKVIMLDSLINVSQASEVRHMLKVIEPHFQRDFISNLPREVSLQILSHLQPHDLLLAAKTCKFWREISEDHLLWKHKCLEEGITEPYKRPTNRRALKNGSLASVCPWKAAYLRQMSIEHNWRCGVKKFSKVLKGHDDHVITCLQFNGSRIVSGSDDNTLKVWSAVSGKCLKTLTGHTGGVWASQMRRNTIISGSTDRTLKIWNADTGECVHTLHGHTSTVRCLALEGNIVVSGSRDATLRMWKIDTGECLHVLQGHLAAVRCVCYDGKKVVSGAYDYMVKVWDPETEECLHTLQGHTNRVYSLQFDGTYVVSGSLDTSIRVWEVETGTCLHTLVGHQSLTSGMELKDNILVSGNADSTVKIWNILTGECLRTLEGNNKHLSAVTCLQFYGKFVITSSDDGTVKLWDVKTGRVSLVCGSFKGES